MARFFIQDVYRITGIGVVPVGRVEDGILRVGMKLHIDGKIMEIRSIEINHQQIREANSGSNVAINLRLINQTSINQNKGFFGRLFQNSDEVYNLLKNYKGKSVEFI